MNDIIEHYQELSALYYRWAMLFRDAEDNASALWSQKLAADYAEEARTGLIKLITKGEHFYE